MAKVEIRGRQYSKRRVTVYKSDDGLFELVEIRPRRVTLATLSKLREEALQTIRAAGIEPAPYFEGSPFGSRLRDAVINSHDRPMDSIEGLAARIYWLAAHVVEYRELGGIDQALDTMGELGELVALFDVYRQVSAEKSDAGKKSAMMRPASKAENIREMGGRLLTEGKGEREISGIIAHSLNVTPQYVRKVLKKRN